MREYALDFAGPNPADHSDNSDDAETIVRQGDGKCVIVSSSNKDRASATAVLRLKRNFVIDTSFGNAGKMQYLAELAVNGLHGQYGGSILLQPGRRSAGWSRPASMAASRRCSACAATCCSPTISNDRTLGFYSPLANRSTHFARS